MVEINANYNAYVEFYKKHKDEIETTGTIKPEDDVKLVVDVAQIYNLMKNEGANAVLVILEQLKHQGVAVEGPHIDLNTGTITFKIGNYDFELNLAEDEFVDSDGNEEGEDSQNGSSGTGSGLRTPVDKVPGLIIDPVTLTPIPVDDSILPVNPTVTGDFNTFESLRNFMFSEARDLVKSKGIVDFTHGFNYEQLAEVVIAKHKDDFRTVTKDVLIDDFVAEYNARVNATEPEPEVPEEPEVTVDFATYTDLRNFTFSNEMRDLLTARGLTDRNYFSSVADVVASRHKEDYATVTKSQLVEEFIVEYNARVNATEPEPEPEVTAPPAETTVLDGKSKIVAHVSNLNISAFAKENDILGADRESFTTMPDGSIHNSQTKETISEDVLFDYFWNNGMMLAGFIEPEYITEYKDLFKKVFKEAWSLVCQEYSDKPASLTTILEELQRKILEGLKSMDDIVIESKPTEPESEPEVTAPPTEPSNESVPFADAVKSISEVVARLANLYSDDIAKEHKTININFTVTNGVFSLNEPAANNVFNKIKQAIKNEIAYKKLQDALATLGGEKVLDSLIQAAWIATYDEFSKTENINTQDFVEKVLNNLTKILNKLETNPELLELFTGSGCYGDTSITNGVKHYGTNTTAGNDENIIISGTVTQYEDGSVHISNDKDDNDYQTTMNEVLVRIKAKYPNIDEKFLEDIFRAAQKEALDIAKNYKSNTVPISIKSITANNTLIHMDDLVNLTLYCFDKLFIEKCMTSTVPPRTEKTEEPVTPLVTKEPDPVFTNALEEAVTVVEHIWNYNVNDISRDSKNIHTEFGLDKNGNIVFQDFATAAVYEKLVNTVKSELEYYDKELLKNLGGDEVLKDLIQAAWISAYNKFPSSQSNNTEAFIEEVLACLKDILNAIKEHPERLDFYRMKLSYADSSLTNGLKHYNTKTTNGNDEIIIYSAPIVYDDGSVHIENDKDDKDYQATMNMLLSRLITKYASYVSSADVTSIFQKAQLEALKAAKNRTKDCPYGTGNNSGRVEDSTRNWDGKNNRENDASQIHMDQLVQLTLYFFDKLLYEHMAKV